MRHAWVLGVELRCTDSAPVPGRFRRLAASLSTATRKRVVSAKPMRAIRQGARPSRTRGTAQGVQRLRWRCSGESLITKLWGAVLRPRAWIGALALACLACGGSVSQPASNAALPPACQALVDGLARCADGLPPSARKPLDELLASQRTQWTARGASSGAFAAGCTQALETMRGATRETCPDVTWTVPKSGAPTTTPTSAPVPTLPSAGETR